MSVEIYIDDLKPDIQRQVLEELRLQLKMPASQAW